VRIEIEPGVRLFIDVEGAALVPAGPTMREKPTLLLLHGGPGWDHSGYKPKFSQLADIAQLVYVDHRGQGRSDKRPREEWTLDHWVDDVVRLCDALGITKPVVFGQSFGGTVAQRYLSRYPEHPARVILSSTNDWVARARVAWRQPTGRTQRQRLRRPMCGCACRCTPEHRDPPMLSCVLASTWRSPTTGLPGRRAR
jgi:proline iminopeptidase